MPLQSISPENTAAVWMTIRRVSERNFLKTTLEKSISEMNFHSFQQGVYHHPFRIPVRIVRIAKGSQLAQEPHGVITLLPYFVSSHILGSAGNWQSLSGPCASVCGECFLSSMNEMLRSHFILMVKKVNALQFFACSVRRQSYCYFCQLQGGMALKLVHVYKCRVKSSHMSQWQNLILAVKIKQVDNNFLLDLLGTVGGKCLFTHISLLYPQTDVYSQFSENP